MSKIKVYINNKPENKTIVKEEIIFNNNLERDIKYFKEQNVGLIINLLSKYDLRVIGVDLNEYETLCKSYDIELITHPIIEMKPPDETPEELDVALIGI